MCGILGGTNPNWSYKSGISKLKHRGPDGSKIEKNKYITMAFARLAIIDLSSIAMQPMWDNKEEVLISFNGEIYGFSKLRLDLVNRGYSFKTNSDTEVLLCSYLEWGEKFLDHIDGMFSIAIYDSRIQKLFLVRDRLGIKPLYYFIDDNELCYSSELKGIVSTVNDHFFRVDNTAVFDFFNYLYIPDPKSLYENVYKLEAGHILTYDLLSKRIISNKEYWNVKINENEGDQIASSDTIFELKHLIKHSIEEQLVADVNVGGFVSGGIDSSIVSLEAVKISDEYKLFSIGFYDFDANELPYVECLEKVINRNVIKHMVDKRDFYRLYNELREWFDEPYCDTSAYPSYIVSKLARNSCTVVLTGDGGDELFGGYVRYLLFNERMMNKQFKSNDEVFDFLWNIHLYPPLPDRIELRKKLNISSDYDEYWYYKKYYIEDLPPITRLQYMDLKTYLPGDILTKMDRVSMAVSLEARVPLLSKEIVEFAFALTQYQRCPQGELKGILKQAYKNELPNNLLYRRKAGFVIPDNFFEFNNPQEQVLISMFPEIIYSKYRNDIISNK